MLWEKNMLICHSWTPKVKPFAFFLFCVLSSMVFFQVVHIAFGDYISTKASCTGTACERTFDDSNVSSSTSSYSHTDTFSDPDEIIISEATTKSYFEDGRSKIDHDKYSLMDRQLIEAKHISDQNSEKDSKIPLYIGGLFELTGPRGSVLGYSELTAARLAVDHVNMDNVIPGYTLTLLHADTTCDPGVGMDAFYNLIYGNRQILMTIGGACSEVTKTLAEIVPYWNLLLVSFASTSPALSEREKYKTFFRLAPADLSHNMPRTMFLRNFNWDTVAILYESTEVFSLAIDEMGRTFEQNNITTKASKSFRHVDQVHGKLREIKALDVRIIFGGFSEPVARYVMCEAYKLGMYGSRYVWIMLSEYVERWWELSNNTTCTRLALTQAVEGYFIIDSLNALTDEDRSSANISLRDFLVDYEKYNGTKPISPYATSTYDTVWTIALTLRKTLHWSKSGENSTNEVSLESFNYDNGEKLRKVFFDIMQDLEFLGISGPISFQGPDREGIDVINQNQGDAMRRIALYEPDNGKLNFYCPSCQPILWKGGRAPRDKNVLVSRQKKIIPVAFYCISCASLVGLLLALIFLMYNLYNRKLRYIKLSSPKLNNVIVIGCMLVYMGIIVLGFDDSSIEDKYYAYQCTMCVFLFAAGFSLAFGAMFTKTYRVHQIITRANRGLIKSKLLRDKQLLFIIGALLIVDSGVVLAWVLVDPMYKQITNLTTEASENDEDLLFIYQVNACYSKHLDKWTGALYAYKGLLLVFGVYMAWETRQVKIPALNDSQYIGMNVYSVVIMSVTVVVLSNILSHNPTIAYVVESSIMLLSTTVTLCLLFVPKVYAIIASKGNSIITTSGIMVDSNHCRRFMVDDRRELLYRAEVQNRVYRREIEELEQEISRIQSLLELPVQPYPKLTPELLCLLPESRVDPSPNARRRGLIEEDRYDFISDAADLCLGVSEARSDFEATPDLKYKEESPKPIRRRSRRFSLRSAKSYAVHKLCKFRPRFSLGTLSDSSDYSGVNRSPFAEGDDKIESLHKNHSSHPLLKQNPKDESKRSSLVPNVHQSNDIRKLRTFDTSESDDENHSLDEAMVKIKCPMTLVTQASVSEHEFDIEQQEIIRCRSFSEGHCQRDSGYRNFLEVPSISRRLTLVDIDEPKNYKAQYRRTRSVLELERRARIRRLQKDLQRIQKELQDLGDLEYQVSEV